MTQDRAKSENNSGDSGVAKNKRYPFRDRFLFSCENEAKRIKDQQEAYTLQLLIREFQDEENYKSEFFKLDFPDDYGGIISLHYQLIPIIDQVQSRIAVAVRNAINRAISKQIAGGNLSPKEKSELVRRRCDQANNMLRHYTESAITRFISTLPRSIQDALENQIAQTVGRILYDWSGLPFEDEKGQRVSLRVEDWPKAVEGLIRQEEKRTRKRIGAPLHGGKDRHKREILESVPEQLRFAYQVRELEKPNWDGKHLWDYIIDKMERDEYSYDGLASLKRDKSLPKIPRDLLNAVIEKRKPYVENRHNIPPKYRPQAFTLKHAYVIATGKGSGIDEKPSYERLRKLLPEAKARLEDVERRSQSDAQEPSGHFRIVPDKKGGITYTETIIPTDKQPRMIFEFPDGQIIEGNIQKPE